MYIPYDLLLTIMFFILSQKVGKSLAATCCSRAYDSDKCIAFLTTHRVLTNSEAECIALGRANSSAECNALGRSLGSPSAH